MCSIISKPGNYLCVDTYPNRKTHGPVSPAAKGPPIKIVSFFSLWVLQSAQNPLTRIEEYKQINKLKTLFRGKGQYLKVVWETNSVLSFFYYTKNCFFHCSAFSSSSSSISSSLLRGQKWSKNLFFREIFRPLVFRLLKFHCLTDELFFFVEFWFFLQLFDALFT